VDVAPVRLRMSRTMLLPVVQSAVGARRLAWDELAGIRVGERGGLWLVTVRGTELRLPVLRARDLPRLSAASGGRIDVPAPPAT
jgi:hypothetical protein